MRLNWTELIPPISVMNTLDYYQLLERIHLHTAVILCSDCFFDLECVPSLSILLTLQRSAKAPAISPNQNKWSFPLHAIYIWHLILLISIIYISVYISEDCSLKAGHKYTLYITQAEWRFKEMNWDSEVMCLLKITQLMNDLVSTLLTPNPGC